MNGNNTKFFKVSCGNNWRRRNEEKVRSKTTTKKSDSGVWSILSFVETLNDQSMVN